MLGMGMVPTMVTTANSVSSCAHAPALAHTAKTAKETQDEQRVFIPNNPKTIAERKAKCLDCMLMNLGVLS
jgi:hypothetical protein